MKVEYRSIKIDSKIRPIFSASPKKKIPVFLPKPMLISKGKEYANSYKLTN